MVAEESDVKKAFFFIVMTGLLGAVASPAFAQAHAVTSPQSQVAASKAAASPASVPSTVSRTTKAVNYRRAGGTTKIDFQGTELMQGATGEAKIESKSNRMEIEAKFQGFEDATKFGLEYLTYVMWAVSSQGRAVNLG